jgi:hypothetical protein
MGNEGVAIGLLERQNSPVILCEEEVPCGVTKMDFRTEVVQRLSEFYRSEGIGKSDFCCPNFSRCHSLAQAGNRGIHFGTEAHVGHLYGSKRRIVVISLDAGGMTDWDSEDIEERTKDIERIEKLDPTINGHMNGTYQFLSVLLSDEVGKASPMPYFALMNSSQCRPFDDRMNQFYRGIHFQCLPFVERALEIVRPEIVWVQGATPRNYFRQKCRKFDDEFIGKLLKNTGLDAARLTTILTNYVARLDGLSYKSIVVYTQFPSRMTDFFRHFVKDDIIDTSSVIIESSKLLGNIQ